MSRATADDATLVGEALGGSEDAYRDLLLRYQRPVFGLIVRLVRDRGLAEDLAQEAFLKAFRALSGFQRERKFSSWLFKIAHNTAIDHLRRRELDTVPLETPEREGPDLLDSLAGPELQSPETGMRRSDLAAALEASVQRLRPEYRTVMELRFREGLSYEEIAEITGLPMGTVKTHIHRARKAMAEHLEELGWSREDV
ncbi:MAG: sigma-70 family RNA polymerase sigma factor [Thermoanaerobaculia bacterium]